MGTNPRSALVRIALLCDPVSFDTRSLFSLSSYVQQLGLGAVRRKEIPKYQTPSRRESARKSSGTQNTVVTLEVARDQIHSDDESPQEIERYWPVLVQVPQKQGLPCPHQETDCLLLKVGLPVVRNLR